MFKTDEQLQQEKIETEKMEKEFESERKREWMDGDLKQRVSEEYDSMIADLRSGKVNPDAYQKKEGLNLNEKEITDLGQSKAFQTLWEKKFQLKQAREEAEGNWKRVNALKKVLRRDDIDSKNFDRLEQSLSPDLMAEYQERVVGRDDAEYQL